MTVDAPIRPPQYMDPSADISSSPSELVSGTDENVFMVGGLTISVEESDGEFIALDVRTGMYGEGDESFDAVLNLLRSLDVLRQELRDREGNLAPELAADLEYLERHLWR